MKFTPSPPPCRDMKLFSFKVVNKGGKPAIQADVKGKPKVRVESGCYDLLGGGDNLFA
jgi:hypothetical protein